ncbi:hypothetical protein [uncultured Chryseobacterium sp.]|uniref:hypothetical protein n=1 Tax=uncultured Chryseobacterium sp. TaxID=259322 RepID=UPI0025FA88E5|nr:hypothetical protein [uncultured Chryseobacterium sp.]
MKKTVVSLLIAAFVIAFCGGIAFITFRNYFPSKSVFDTPNMLNDKMVNILNTEIEKEIYRHTQSVMYPGYIPEAGQNTIRYLKTIKSIESYARYGVNSTQPRNYIELKITFNDGSQASEIYTGRPCSAYIETCLLIKAEMKDGKAVKVYTNGQERKGSPDRIIPDLSLLIDKAIAYDIDRNRNHYFEPEKTQKDFDREWENQK